MKMTEIVIKLIDGTIPEGARVMDEKGLWFERQGSKLIITKDDYRREFDLVNFMRAFWGDGGGVE